MAISPVANAPASRVDLDVGKGGCKLTGQSRIDSMREMYILQPLQTRLLRADCRADTLLTLLVCVGRVCRQEEMEAPPVFRLWFRCRDGLLVIRWCWYLV